MTTMHRNALLHGRPTPWRPLLWLLVLALWLVLALRTARAAVPSTLVVPDDARRVIVW